VSDDSGVDNVNLKRTTPQCRTPVWPDSKVFSTFAVSGGKHMVTKVIDPRGEDHQEVYRGGRGLFLRLKRFEDIRAIFFPQTKSYPPPVRMVGVPHYHADPLCRRRRRDHR